MSGELNTAQRLIVAEQLARDALAEVRSLRGVVQAVRDLADKWEREAGPESRAWEVFGEQSVSVPFAVEKIRAALAAAAERSPDAPQPADLGHDCSTRCDGADSELPGMWEHADFLGGADAPQSEPSTQEHDWGCREWGCDHPSPAVLPET